MANSRRPVGLIGPEREIHIDYVRNLLDRRGVPSRILDTQAFPAHHTLEWSPDAVRWDGFDLSELRSVYVRLLMSHPMMDPAFDQAMQKNWYATLNAFREKGAALAGMLDRLNCPVINPLAADRRCQKPVQLRLFQVAGLPIPDTIVTNDPESVREFVARYQQVIYKPVQGGATVQPLTLHDLTAERLELLRSAPVQFQEYIAGENIRTYIVGEEVVAAAVIETEDIYDFRRAEGAARLIDLPTEIVAMCLAAARSCRLAFTGIDIKRDGERYVFLEANPSPMFFGFDQKTGAGVGERLAELLAR